MLRLQRLSLSVIAGFLVVSFGMGDVHAVYSKNKSPKEKAAELEKKATAKYNDGVKKMAGAKRYLAEGNTRLATKQLEKAAKRFTEAVAYTPDFPEALNNLGFSLRLTGRYEEALQHYNRAIELKPDFMEAHEYRARAHLGMDNVKLAKADYQWLLEHKHDEEAALLKEAIDAWVLAKVEGEKISVEKVGW